MKLFKEKTILLLFLVISVSYHGFGQAVSSIPAIKDTSLYQTPKAIRFVDINFELERSRKKLVKIVYELAPNPEIDKLDTLVERQKVFMNNELKEYTQFNPYSATRRCWSTERSCSSPPESRK